MRANLLLLGVGSLLLASQASQGQSFPHYSPPPMAVNPAGMNNMYFGGNSNPNYRKGEGSYQLADGTWHRAEKLVFDGQKLVVKNTDADKLKLTATNLRQLEIARDTFLVMVDLPGRSPEYNRPEFVQSAFHRRGVRVLALYSEYSKPLYFVSLPQLPLQLLPSGKADFKAAMLRIVQDCPALVVQVDTGKLGRGDVVQIMQQYVDYPRPAASAQH